MRLNEVDEHLARWRDRQRLIDENLQAFVELPAYTRLAGRISQPSPTLSGQSLERIADAVARLLQIYDHYQALRQTLDRASEQRAILSRMIPSKHALAEIENLLTGNSIQMPAPQTPAERRELLGEVTGTMQLSPDELLETMLESFRVVRDSFLAVADAEDLVAAELEARESEIASTTAALPTGAGTAFKDGGIGSPDAATKLLAEIRGLWRTDPLAAAEQIPALADLLKKMRESLAAVERCRIDVVAHWAEAGEMMKRLGDLHRRALQACAERKLKVQLTEDQALLPTADTDIADLEAWLARLNRTVDKREFGPAQVGLRKWLQSAAAIWATDEAALSASDSALGARRDLRGLFEALHAKAVAAGRVEDAKINSLARRIRQLLATRPTPMTETGELVAQYQQMLL